MERVVRAAWDQSAPPLAAGRILRDPCASVKKFINPDWRLIAWFRLCGAANKLEISLHKMQNGGDEAIPAFCLRGTVGGFALAG
jgi:hypothetical protein